MLCLPLTWRPPLPVLRCLSCSCVFVALPSIDACGGVWQAEHEAQRTRNAELVAMQEESALKQEQLRRSTEEQIQNQLRQTELVRSEPRTDGPLLLPHS